MGGSEQVIIIGLRLVHILAGVFWVGAALTFTRFILPSIQAVGPSGGALMREIGQRRRFPVYMNFAALFTLLSGIGLYWRMTALSSGAFARSPMGMTLGIGALFAIAGSIVGNVMARPAGMRLAALGGEIASAGGPPTDAQRAELAAVQARLSRASAIVGMLLVLATAAMAVARYV